ncbi:hypothetical protein Poli38472_013804 [Pythium oligandrum]|uniref:WW domain-containing protein n=1 Tax=Pythium oligandrum TaxID=41045 RepID=A0A8K1C243_PYTOL|nr:hypothetical protein Poli38472_013804 [Pythium oligandrum]|eukprot:TMW55042.1 hypothetical protein Poli38472_013804 [Pythium oligandrum]
MPSSSFFKRKTTRTSSGAGDKRARQRQDALTEAKEVFQGDQDLLQLHEETTELLRLVKTPAKIKSPSIRRQAPPSPLKGAATRVTIEVLENDEDEEQNDGDNAAAPSQTPPIRRPIILESDPFAFDAEETRVRGATDTFLPDTSPSKRAVERQREQLTAEQKRLDRIKRNAAAQVERHEYTTQNHEVVNRVERSAIKIQAHSRGFICRRRFQATQKAADENQVEADASQWHEVRDVEKNEIWYYNAHTGQSQWEKPRGFVAPPASALPSIHSGSGSNAGQSLLPRLKASSSSSDLPPLSPIMSRPSSSNSDVTPRIRAYSSLRGSASLPSLGKPDYASNPWECDSVSGSDQVSLCSERLEDDDPDNPPPPTSETTYENGDWQINDSLFLADGSKNSKLRDTIRQALQVSKFDSISSLIASNVVLRKKPRAGIRGEPAESPNQRTSQPSPAPRGREIVLGKRDAPMFVAVLNNSKGTELPSVTKSTSKAKQKRKEPGLVNPLASPPRIRDLVDPGFHEDLPSCSSTQPENTSTGPSTVCFNCWSSSNGRYCEIHQDPNAHRKVKASESALMCANWNLDQLCRKYRAEEIQEIFMKQNASLRYDKRLKQYVTVIECRHPIYRLVEQLLTAWNKTMRRKLHTRAWFRSFMEQLRAGGVPKADSSTPKLLKLKNTLQNHRWVGHYSATVVEFHPKPPITSKNQTGQRIPIPDTIMIDPATPQMRNWILVTEYTKPVELYKPRVYELPPRRCVPMPTPSFLEDIPLPVPNVFIDCGHIASWFERLSARVSTAAIHKALQQIHACTPPRGATNARKTKHVTPVTVLFATFGRKLTKGNIAVGGLSAELLIHMLVTTYIPAQYGHFIVFERRALSPSPTKDHDALEYVCLIIDPTTMQYVARPLEHALNVRRPPCITLATSVIPTETDVEAMARFPSNHPEQTGEEPSHGFRTFWLVDAFVVRDDVSSVTVQPTADVLSPNTTSMNATVTTKVDRYYPFCIATTKENTPIEFIHLLWIGQSSRNQPQTFTTLGAQQPGEFMKHSDPNGALGVCTSVIYRSWAYMQSSPYEEFTTEDGVAYWYDKQSGETFWLRPILPMEKVRGKDGEVDGVIADGQGEVATLGVGVDNARYSQQDLRKYLTKKLEAPEDKEKRIQRVSASARKHEITVSLGTEDGGEKKRQSTQAKAFPVIQVPKLSFKREKTKETEAKKPATTVILTKQSPAKPAVAPATMDPTTQQLIATITQALGSALPAAGGSSTSGVDMLQLGIGLGMGLGLRTQQQQALSPTHVMASTRSSNRPYSAQTQSGNPQEDLALSTTRSDVSWAGSDDLSALSARSMVSTAPSVELTPSPDEMELLSEEEKARFARAGYGEKTPGYHTHPPPGEGHTWVDQPVDASSASQTAVEGYGGSLHQRVACLPKDFVAAVSSTKTCKMQANYLPIVKNMNQPRSVGIVRPRPALDEWLSVGYSPWNAGRAVFGRQFISNLMHRPELIAQQKAGGAVAGSSASPSTAAVATVEKKENVTQAVKEAQQLDTVFSLCRHGKYDELEKMITSPDWTLSIDAKDVMGNTLLSIACQNNNKRIAKLCLRRAADINTQNLNGQTVLHYCHEYGFHDLMEYLMDKGARDDILNADGLTCYEGLSKEAVDAI